MKNNFFFETLPYPFGLYVISVWVGGVVDGGPQIFSVSLSPLGTNWTIEFIRAWLGLGLGGLELDNLTIRFSASTLLMFLFITSLSCKIEIFSQILIDLFKLILPLI